MDIFENLARAVEAGVEALPNKAAELVLKEALASGLLSNYTLLSMLFTFLRTDTFQIKLKPEIKKAYDYIVVGGGSAGAVMASRLSETPCVTVLLLEAGGEPPILTEVPGLARLFQDSDVDWQYNIEPQENCAFGHKENRITWNSGKVLGGTSTINSMLYVRGSKKTYNDWEAEGATGWGYDDVLPYFKKAEDNRNIDELDTGYHQRGGPLSVENINYTPELKTAILNATTALGYEKLDINGRRQTGSSKLQATYRDQKRCSTVKAYLDPARNRKNLDILTNAFVRKILIDPKAGRGDSKGRARGVEFDYMGVTHNVQARQEVILSAGSVRTPQILMLSGIGPKEDLERLKINVVANLPVGKNLQDHYGTHLIYKVNNTKLSIILRNLNPVNVGDYIINRKGPLASAEQILVGVFLNGRNTTADSADHPRQAVWFMEFDTLDAKLHFNLKDELYDKVYAPHILKPVFLCFPTILQPRSRGEILLNSIDPYDMPIIKPNYYKDNRDLSDVVEGMKACNDITKHPAMRRLQAELIEEQRSGFPKCEEEYEKGEDAYYGCIATQVMNTLWHYSGTARMGHKDDSRSVVDPELRVIKVKGLRVVDASVMPIIPTANTNAPTIMVAERAYGLMKNGIQCGPALPSV